MSVRPLRRLIPIAVLGLVMSSAAASRADGRAELEKARASFLARNWVDAEERLRVLLDPKTGLKDRPLISQARMYFGASLLEQGKKDEAKDSFEKLVLEDPSFEPDPLSFPSEAINTFIDVRSSLMEQIKEARQAAARLAADRRAREEAEREAQRVWLEKVKAQAGEEKITVRNSRVVASLPFGAGQFQNRQVVLGAVFLGAEVAALGGTAITYGMFRYARERENAELLRFNRLTAFEWHQQAEDLRTVNLGFLGGFLAVTAIGIVQANVAFVPESAEKKKRELPPVETPPPRAATADKLSPVSAFAPIVSILPAPGAGVGVGGVFLGVGGALF